MTEPEFVTLTEAAKLLGVSHMTIYRRVKEGALTVYDSPANRRVRLVRRSDVEALRTPRIARPLGIRTEQGDATDA